MIYRRAVIRACARYAALVSPVVTGISGLVFFSRLLGDTAAGAIPAFILGQLFVLTLIKYAPQLLILSAFAGVFIAMRRAYTLHEMEAWFSAGLGARNFILPALQFALPAAAFVALFSLVAAPWAVHNINATRLAAAFAVNPETLPRDQFSAAPGGTHSYFYSSDNTLFLASNQRDEIVLARGAATEDGAALILTDGHLHALTQVNEQPVMDSMRFATLRLALPAASDAGVPPRAKSSTALRWHNLPERGELLWRLMLPAAAIALALFALALAPAYTAAARRFGFLAAIAVFFLYLNGMRLARDLIEKDQIPALAAFIAPPLVMALIVGALMRLFSRR